uniref:Uncharacterized protein n=1 Tax=Plectus sambesii TaxID=2011161 RepID=A0A914WBY9_9BILA
MTGERLVAGSPNRYEEEAGPKAATCGRRPNLPLRGREAGRPPRRHPSYWHFGQRQVGNALKYYAIKADPFSKADTESDASDESDKDFNSLIRMPLVAPSGA